MIDFQQLSEQIARNYRPAGRFAEGFVRGKLKHDPLYCELLKLLRGEPLHGRVLDLGCGRGILLSLLAADLETRHSRGGLPLTGIEWRAADGAAARLSLGERAEIIQGDVRKLPLPVSQVILLLDLLLYLPADDQVKLLQRSARALEPGGLLLLREADASQGWRFRITRLAEGLCTLARFQPRQRYHYRSVQAWHALLNDLGLEVSCRPMSEGTPFANVLFMARKPPRSAPRDISDAPSGPPN